MDSATIALRNTLAHDVAAISRRWRSLRERRLRASGLTSGAWSALEALAGQDGLSQAALCERIGAEPPAMVRIIDGLAQQGLVERRPSPTDRRVNLVHLRAEAHTVIRRLETIAADIQRAVTRGIGPDDLSAASALLETVRRNLETLDPPAETLGG